MGFWSRMNVFFWCVCLCVFLSFISVCMSVHTLVKWVGWPKPYTHTVYDRVFGDFPAKNTVYTTYMYGSGQPYTCVFLFAAHCFLHPVLYPFAQACTYALTHTHAHTYYVFILVHTHTLAYTDTHTHVICVPACIGAKEWPGSTDRWVCHCCAVLCLGSLPLFWPTLSQVLHSVCVTHWVATHQWALTQCCFLCHMSFMLPVFWTQRTGWLHMSGL